MIRHISTSISYLLTMSDEQLSNAFECDGAEVRKELLERQAAGEMKIGSEGCEGFDPVKGCPGHPSQEKQSFAKITYYNCGLDYVYTLCEWQDVNDNIEIVKPEMENFDPKDLDESFTPSVLIEPILMTNQEFEKWFIKNVESKA